MVAGALLAGLTFYPVSPGPAQSRVVVAALPYWNIGHGAATVLAHRGDFTEVSPWTYGLASSGRIDAQYPPGRTATVNKAIARMRAAGLQVVPTLANITAGNWSYQPIAGILHDPARRKQHVAAIVALVRQHHYAGIDIDYENLQPAIARHSRRSSANWPRRCTHGARFSRSRCSPRPPTRDTPPATSRRITPPSAGSPTRCGS